jgi:ABC-type branched-subunit amino acid transport system substrate-binding protein
MRYILPYLTLMLLTGAALADDRSIGVILPLTGPYANFGEAARTGLDIALHRPGASPLRVIYEDSQYDGAHAVTAFTKLNETSKLTALFVLGSPPSAALIPLAEKRQLPLFAWTPSLKLTSGRPGVVRLMAAAADQGALMAAQARARSYSQVGFFSAQNEFSQSLRDAFLSAYGSSAVPFAEEFAPSETDFRTQLAKARARGVRSLGVCLNTGQIPAFLDQVHALAFNLPLFGCHALSSPEVLSSLNKNGMNAWFVEGVVSKDFQEQFKKRSPDTSGIWLAAAFHDVGALLSSTPQSPDLIASLIDKPVPNSAFGKSKVVKGDSDTYLDIRLGITQMVDGEFRRNVP